jgi:hypothetical protein
MARKKKEPTVQNENDQATAVAEFPVAIPVEAETPAEAIPVTPVTPTATGTPNGNGHALNGTKKPLVSYRLNSDRTTSIEVSVWSNTHKAQDGSAFEQISVTIGRSYKDQNGAWCKGGSYRSHDIPCLLFLLNKAYSFALDRRCEDSSMPF